MPPEGWGVVAVGCVGGICAIWECIEDKGGKESILFTSLLPATLGPLFISSIRPCLLWTLDCSFPFIQIYLSITYNNIFYNSYYTYYTFTLMFILYLTYTDIDLYLSILYWCIVAVNYYLSYRSIIQWFIVFKDYTPFIVIIKYWLYFLCCTLYPQSFFCMW